MQVEVTLLLYAFGEFIAAASGPPSTANFFFFYVLYWLRYIYCCPCWSTVPRSIAAARGTPAWPSRRNSAHPVYGRPLPDRASFPENHRLYQGPLPMTIAGAEQSPARS